MPEDPLLIYDGECQFCVNSVRLGQQKLLEFPKVLASQQLTEGQFGLARSQLKSKVWLVDQRSGRRLGGHLAVAELLSRQPSRLLRILGWLGKNPPSCYLAAGLYALIATIRHRLVKRPS